VGKRRKYCELQYEFAMRLNLKPEQIAAKRQTKNEMRLPVQIKSADSALFLPMYVIGGGVASAWDAFAPSMLNELRARSFVYTATGSPEDGAADKTIRNESVPRQGTVNTPASLGSGAVLLGAARLPMIAATNQVLEAKSQKV
jgi:hypothetical protein